MLDALDAGTLVVSEHENIFNLGILSAERAYCMDVWTRSQASIKRSAGESGLRGRLSCGRAAKLASAMEVCQSVKESWRVYR